MMKILGKIIEGFPYPVKHCFYCEREIKLMKAAHLEEQLQYKAVFFCLNKECGAYDEPARKCYALVYYSSPEAQRMLEGFPIWMPERKSS